MLHDTHFFISAIRSITALLSASANVSVQSVSDIPDMSKSSLIIYTQFIYKTIIFTGILFYSIRLYQPGFYFFFKYILIKCSIIVIIFIMIKMIRHHIQESKIYFTVLYLSKFPGSIRFTNSDGTVFDSPATINNPCLIIYDSVL